MTQAASATLDETVIRRLLEELASEATRFRFEVAANPCVGAAVLSGERVLGRGYHEVWGGAHAEVQAIAAARASGVPQSAWDTLVVTLEPCSSQGKTPPCTDAIRASGIKRVIVGALDPDRRHQGAGLRLLQEAGVEVLLCDDVVPLARYAPHFLRWTDQDRMRRPRPWTIAKWAQTRTGQLIPPEGVGEGRWISGPDALREVQLLRGRVDAIVTGVGTVLADDPRFSVRAPGERSRPPARLVFDSYLRTPPGSALFAGTGADEAAGPVHLLCLAGIEGARERALLEAGAHVHALHVSSEREISLREAQAWMWEQGFRRVVLEAGPTLLSSYLAAGLVDQLRIYTGAVNGGRGPSMAESLVRLKLEGRLERELGGDSVLEAFVVER
jgi:diaminohydroxyphosphoribosylaminopyrimidine deaminase/5-amino-6-(5-phosphoribosylamino)uracil reductase